MALALIEFAKALVAGGEFARKGALWVSEPNFVAFKIPKRSRQVVFSVYGFSTGFKKCPALGIYWSRSSYSEFRLDSPRQLGAAAAYIATSFIAPSSSERARRRNSASFMRCCSRPNPALQAAAKPGRA